MFDDLRNNADNKPPFTDDNDDAELEPLLKKSSKKQAGFGMMSGGLVLGMTAFQRFVISALIFLMVCILGAMLVMLRSSMLM